MTARHLARLVAILGAVGVGWLLLDARPRDVVLVYDVSAVPDATWLAVQIRRNGERLRHADLRLDPGAQVRHPVRLPDGTYQLVWRLSTGVVHTHTADAEDGVVQGERELVVDGEGTIVLPLRP